jgi:hypothetical protein
MEATSLIPQINIIKLRKKTTFVSCFVKLHYFTEFVPFCFVPSYGMNSSEILGITRNEHFIPRNNENRSESIPQNFFGTKFRWQPYVVALPLWRTEQLGFNF